MQVKVRSLHPRAQSASDAKLGGLPAGRASASRGKDGSMEQAWHCLPFSEAARYGIELFYPYSNEFSVRTFRRRSSFSTATSG